MITIHFEGVGRDKKSWSAQFKMLTHSVIMKSIRTHGALMSRDVELDFDTATIYAGFRSVGKFRVEGLPLNHEFADSPAAKEKEAV